MSDKSSRRGFNIGDVFGSFFGRGPGSTKPGMAEDFPREFAEMLGADRSSEIGILNVGPEFENEVKKALYERLMGTATVTTLKEALLKERKDFRAAQEKHKKDLEDLRQRNAQTLAITEQRHRACHEQWESTAEGLRQQIEERNQTIRVERREKHNAQTVRNRFDTLLTEIGEAIDNGRTLTAAEIEEGKNRALNSTERYETLLPPAPAATSEIEEQQSVAASVGN